MKKSKIGGSISCKLEFLCENKAPIPFDSVVEAYFHINATHSGLTKRRISIYTLYRNLREYGTFSFGTNNTTNPSSWKYRLVKV